MQFSRLGYSPFFQKSFATVDVDTDGTIPARVVRQDRDRLTLCSERGLGSGQLSGSFLARAASRSDFPVIGDFVAARPVEATSGEDSFCLVEIVLPRQSLLTRRNAGGDDEQPLAANVDIVAVVAGLDKDYNPRRLERSLVVAWASGARPAVLLTKADLRDEAALGEALGQTRSLAPGAEVIAVSAKTGRNMQAVRDLCGPGVAMAFLGSSGAGKSTLLNALLGEERQKTSAVREDDSRGRHTTTRRELFLLPSGGLVIDAPGIREVGLTGSGRGLSRAFEDVEELGGECRFSDCGHETEPGCAVLRAVEEGRLDHDRYASYLRLRREQDRACEAADIVGRIERKRREKRMGRLVRSLARDHHKR